MRRTPDQSRRAVIVGGAAAIAAARPLTAVAQPDSLQRWLAAAAIPVRSIDAADEDFTDLEPVAQVIGAARVVQLGEPSHGAGASFSAKARLVKFLHQRLGFDVLIWESGLYDVELARAGMRSGEDAMAAARRGIFTLWSDAAEVKPLFEHVKASQAGTRPLDMAGFDMQVTARGSIERFATDLRAFAGTGMAEPAEAAIAVRARLFASRFADEGDLQRLKGAVDDLLGAISSGRRKVVAAHGEAWTDFMARAIANVRADAINRYEAARASGPSVERENRRDAHNAETLRWLLEDRFQGRKAVVWAHNAHIMNAYYAPDFHTARVKPVAGDMKPMGVFLKNWLGDAVYTVGVTAFAGRDGLAIEDRSTEISPAPDGSLEARLHALGRPQVFVDFRSAAGQASQPIREPLSCRVPKYESSVLADVTRVYDGVLFIDRMSPATPAGPASKT